jgi:hypothetical protein
MFKTSIPRLVRISRRLVGQRASLAHPERRAAAVTGSGVSFVGRTKEFWLPGYPIPAARGLTGIKIRPGRGGTIRWLRSGWWSGNIGELFAFSGTKLQKLQPANTTDG